jgi:hypothetical protein
MSTNTIAGAYLVKGTIGNEGIPGAAVVNYALVVVPAANTVTGSVQITQAVANGNYSGSVTGHIYATGLGQYTQVVALTGSVNNDGTMPLQVQFNAHMAIDGSWNGVGGFSYANVHIDSAPVTSTQE